MHAKSAIVVQITSIEYWEKFLVYNAFFKLIFPMPSRNFE